MGISDSAAVFFILIPTACSGILAIFEWTQIPFSTLHFSQSLHEPFTNATAKVKPSLKAVFSSSRHMRALVYRCDHNDLPEKFAAFSLMISEALLWLSWRYTRDHKIIYFDNVMQFTYILLISSGTLILTNNADFSFNS